MTYVQPFISGLTHKADVHIGYLSDSLVGKVVAYRLDGGAYCVHPFI